MMKFFKITNRIKYRYSIANGNLFVEDTQTGLRVWEGRPENKIIDEVLPLYGSDDCIILFNIHKGYENELKKRNICRCNPKGRIIWRASLPESPQNQHDYFVYIGWSEGELRASTWTTYSVTINPRNGRIISQYLTK